MIAALLYGIISKSEILTIITCLSGILYMVFLSERNILNFIIGFISTTTYIFIAFKAKLFGEVIFYIFFDLPMIFISYFMWKKHLDTKLTVYSRKLSLKNAIILIVSSVLIIIVYGIGLRAMGDSNPFFDATSTVISLIATILMALRFKEQWILWILVYFVGIFLWMPSQNILMFIMEISCFISAIIGYINWTISQKQNKENK